MDFPHEFTQKLKWLPGVSHLRCWSLLVLKQTVKAESFPKNLE